MAKAIKTPDPAEAALSAIEEALNSPATGTDGPMATPRLPKAKMPRIDKAPEVKFEPALEQAVADAIAAPPAMSPPALTPPAAANEPLAAPAIAPPRTAANDDRRNGAALLSSLQERPSRMPHWIAALLSLGWLTLVLTYAYNTYDSAISATGGYLAQGNLPQVAAIAVAALLPVIFMFTTASMVRRAQEMRIAARALTEAALRLAQPETIASDSVFSLGQAIRREVASMGDGIERAVARASELEALVHSEVSQLERSYSDNELKIRMLLDELANQRDAINNNATSVRAAIMGAHDNLSNDMQTVSQRITESVTAAGDRVTSALDERRDQIANSLSRAGDQMIDQITVRSSELIDRLSATGESVNDKIAATSLDVTRTITDSGAQLVAEIAERGQSVTAEIESTGSAVTTRFSQSAEAVNEALNLTGNTLVNSIADRAQSVNDMLEHTGNTLVSAITDRSQTVVETLDDTGRSLIDAIGGRAQEVNNTMRATGEALVIDLGIRGAEVTQRLEETGTKIAETVTSRGDSLAARLVETSDRINDSITIHGKSLEDSIAQTGQQAAHLISEQVGHARSAFEGAGQVIATVIDGRTRHAETMLNSHAADVESRLTGHADQVTSRLAETGKDIVLAIATQGNRVNEALADNARGLTGTLEAHSINVSDHLRSFDETVGARLQNVEAVVTIHGTALVDRLAGQTESTTQALESQLTAFEERSIGRAKVLSGSFDELIQRVDTGLERRGQQLNETLSQRAIEIARIMGEGGRDVTAAMETKAREIDDVINSRTTAMTEQLGARAQEITGVLTAKADEINATLGGRASEIAETLDTRIGTFEERIVHRLDGVSDAIDKKGFQLAASLGQRTEEINTLFVERGANLVGELGARGQAIAREVADVGETVIRAIETRGSAVADVLEKNGSAVAALIDTKGQELTGRINASTHEFNEAIVGGAEQSVRGLTQAHRKLSGEITEVLNRLGDANGTLNNILASATNNLEAVETGLTERVRELESAMGQIIADTSNTSERVEKQVGVLREVSGGVLREASVLSQNIQLQGTALLKVTEELSSAQGRFDMALQRKHGDVQSIVSAIEQQNSEMESMMTGFQQLLQDSLSAAEAKAREVSSTLHDASQSATANISEQYEMIRTLSAKERERTGASLRASYDQAMGELGSVFSEATVRFRDTAEQLRGMTADITQELEATRAEISRSTSSMPRDLKAQTGAIKRAVGDQLLALNELNAIVERTNLDATPATVLKRAAPVVERSVPPPAVVPRAPAPPRAPVPERSTPPSGRTGGWLSDLLTSASTDAAVAPQRTARARPTEQGLEALDVISGDIARLVDSDAVMDAWDRYTGGERSVFSRRLYTLQGQQTFDEVRRRYRREPDFRETIDRYVEEFERLLKDVASEGRDGSVARTYLTSDTGKVYTMLAHAAGRFE